MLYGFKNSNSVLQTDSLSSLVRLGPKPCSLQSILGSLIRLEPKLYYLNRCLYFGPSVLVSSRNKTHEEWEMLEVVDSQKTKKYGVQYKATFMDN